MTKKKALIITDGTQSINSIALPVSEALKDFSVKVCPAEEFDATDLLAANIFFLGCENPNPSSFSCLKELFSHINLASRKCGIFTVNEKTIDYLKNILKDSEASLGEPLFLNGKIDETAIAQWLNKLL